MTFNSVIQNSDVKYSSYTVDGEKTTYGNTIANAENIEDIEYEGSVVDGVQKSVFAFLGKPNDFDASQKYPAVVLVHGGGGNADPLWVKNWTDNGFVALSMDMYGNIIKAKDYNSFDKVENPNAIRTDPYSAATSFKASAKDSMMYHNVTAVIKAHNLLRSLPYVDENEIGISGISWGAVTTSTVIGADNRFAFAVPIYGCGYLYESQTEFKTMLGDNLYWDPSNFIVDTTVPTLWLSSASDPWFSINSFSKSYELAESANGNARMVVVSDSAGSNGFGHSQQTARKAEKAWEFAKAIVNGTEFAAVASVSYDENTRVVSVGFSGCTPQSAEVVYNTDLTIPMSNGNADAVKWTKANAEISGSSASGTVPETAKRFYVNLLDSNGKVLISSKLTEVE